MTSDLQNMKYLKDIGIIFFYSSRSKHTEYISVNGVQTCALPILAQITGSRPAFEPADEISITDVAPINDADPSEIAFLGDAKRRSQLADTKAGLCLVAEALLGLVPKGTLALVTDTPELAFARVLAEFYPDAASSTSWGRWFSGFTRPVHPQARLEEGVRVCPGAVICEGAEIGAGTVIGPNAIIGPKVKIGRDCSNGPDSTITHTLVGNGVIVHAGADIGQDGFGYTAGPGGMVKIPQIGRVVIQDDVEIGSNTTIDRGALVDTVVGEGTKLDNLVQLAHNVAIGRHCAIASQSGMSGSVTLGDAVMVGGQVGVTPHSTVGSGAQLAGGAGIVKKVNPGERVAGRPHRPVEQMMREIWIVGKLAREHKEGRRGRAKKGEGR